MKPYQQSQQSDPPASPEFTYDESAAFEPDPARSYERAKPHKEYGDDRLDAAPSRRCCAPDQMIRAVHNAHESHQVNSESSCDAGASCPLDE